MSRGTFGCFPGKRACDNQIISGKLRLMKATRIIDLMTKPTVG